MNVLFVLDAEMNSCFYLLSLDKTGKTLLRFGPEQKIADRILGDVYQSFADDSKGFCQWLQEALQVEIKHYVILTEDALCDFLFAKEDVVEVRNPKAFTFHGVTNGDNPWVKDRQDFPKGPQSLDFAAFLRFITYQEDAPGVFGIYNRQEHVMRLIKESLLSSFNPVSLTKTARHLLRLVNTDLGLTDCLRLVGKYQESKGKMQRITGIENVDAKSLVPTAIQISLSDFQ